VKTSRSGVELSKNRLQPQEVFVSHATHANAALTPRARLPLARLIVDDNWSIPRAAERYDVLVAGPGRVDGSLGTPAFPAACGTQSIT
jgi:hypothetical protein